MRHFKSLILLAVLLCTVSITGCTVQHKTTDNIQSANTKSSVDSVLISNDWYEVPDNGVPGPNTGVLDFNSDGTGIIWFTVGDGGTAAVDFTYEISQDGKISLNQTGRNGEMNLPDEWKEISVSFSQKEYFKQTIDVMTVALKDKSQVVFFSDFLEDCLKALLISTKWYESGVEVGPGISTSVLELNSDGTGAACLAIGDGGTAEVEFTYFNEATSSDAIVFLEQPEDVEGYALPDEWKELSLSFSQEEYNNEQLDVMTVTLADGKQIKFYSEYIDDEE